MRDVFVAERCTDEQFSVIEIDARPECMSRRGVAARC